MKYINYNDMKAFYTIDEVCRLFEMDKAGLRHYAEKYNISPQEDQYGNWGFRKVLVRKLHNYIYKEQRNAPDDGSSPWGNNKSEKKSDPGS
ncbi:MerR family transcriptional regulator [Agathobaculum sp. Marseille-P7918]|uniref:MerR family transcriptional regulator n=1 Tax=Agathobaculum sp. Marseille-P7918 TaxID=2479843 RepID=UPI000F638974|nr:MerR family transcriptional regulator [Agathobaculum sp. Marseille-P7918]